VPLDISLLSLILLKKMDYPIGRFQRKRVRFPSQRQCCPICGDPPEQELQKIIFPSRGIAVTSYRCDLCQIRFPRTSLISRRDYWSTVDWNTGHTISPDLSLCVALSE